VKQYIEAQLINALKHAFASTTAKEIVIVGYESDGSDWKRSVSDNGSGMPPQRLRTGKSGLGTTLIKALVKQIGAQRDIPVPPSYGPACTMWSEKYPAMVGTSCRLSGTQEVQISTRQAMPKAAFCRSN
jgi:nitrate/nitrite-specific signal transduction histidine kinase